MKTNRKAIKTRKVSARKWEMRGERRVSGLVPDVLSCTSRGQWRSGSGSGSGCRSLSSCWVVVASTSDVITGEQRRAEQSSHNIGSGISKSQANDWNRGEWRAKNNTLCDAMWEQRIFCQFIKSQCNRCGAKLWRCALNVANMGRQATSLWEYMRANR